MSGLYKFDFYPRDWLTGTRALSLDGRGLYADLIAMMYERGGPIPYNEQELKHALACDVRVMRRIIGELVGKQKIETRDGFIFNRRVLDEIERMQKKSAKLPREVPDNSQGSSGEVRHNSPGSFANLEAGNESDQSHSNPPRGRAPASASPSPSKSPSKEPSTATSSLQAARPVADAADDDLEAELEALDQRPATRREKLAELTPHHPDPVASDPISMAIGMVLEACGNSPNLIRTGRVKAWLDDGFDLQLDILPAIRACLAKKPAGWSPTTLGYFDQPIADWKAERIRPMPVPRPGGDGPPERPATYDNMMVGSPEHKRWLQERGLA